MNDCLITVENLGLDDMDIAGLFSVLENLADVGKCDANRRWKLIDMIYGGSGAHKHVFVAKVNGEVVGTATALIEGKVIHGFGRVCHIEDVAVREDYEREGVGRAVVEAAINCGRNFCCYKAVLSCSEKNVPFYEKIGFNRYEVGMRIEISDGHRIAPDWVMLISESQGRIIQNTENEWKERCARIEARRIENEQWLKEHGVKI